MKFYIASRVKNRELVKEIHKQVTTQGYKISSTWVDEEDIIPYKKHTQAASSRSAQCIKTSSECDVFILVSDSEGAGMYTELGAALHANTQTGKPKIYVIGDHLNRSVFFFHPAVKRFETLKNVLDDLEK